MFQGKFLKTLVVHYILKQFRLLKVQRLCFSKPYKHPVPRSKSRTKTVVLHVKISSLTLIISTILTYFNNFMTKNSFFIRKTANVIVYLKCLIQGKF